MIKEYPLMSVSTGCEEEDKCCFCIPIMIGMKINSCLDVVWSIVWTLLITAMLASYLINGPDEDNTDLPSDGDTDPTWASIISYLLNIPNLMAAHKAF